ncbi:helix-turn-helix domain-containing protein [Actinomyces oricola]|uniref:helix-turn-helix domain-containing protein n=1 Tax=Actinomyces oricola TaxID=206043 RepID=UPI001F4FF2DE|nr:helix-turn-helix domain-containing protein [Actinomyces oricola]
MNLHEMTFHVEHVDDSLVDTLIDDYDGTVGTDHTGHEFVTVLGEGANFDVAARTMITELQSLGLRLLRLVPDLATRPEIASRLGVTRQAVQNWTSGKRQNGFPLAINPVGGGVWSWHDIWDWAITHGHAIGDDVHYPSQAEVDIINAWLESSMTSTPVAHRTQRRTGARVTSGTLRPRRATAPAMQTAPGSCS